VQNLGLGGIFAWELTGDTDDYELLSAMNNGKRQLSFADEFLQN